MTEAELHNEVVNLITSMNLWWFTVPDSRRTVRGWPDLVILGSWHALFRELKSEEGRSSTAQIQCGRRMARAGLDYAVWRPADLESGRIRKELSTIAVTVVSTPTGMI